MGKKIKKVRTPQKDKRGSNSSQKKESGPTEQSVGTVDGEGLVAKERKPCVHLGKGIDLNALSSKIASLETVRCEDCRDGAGDRRGGKGKGNKPGKKKGNGLADAKSDSKAIWVCLACGHYACGGVGLPTGPQCHALRHARQTRHPLVVQFEKPQLRWCFPCNSLVPAEKAEENDEQKDVFMDVVKLVKGRLAEGSGVNVEDGFGKSVVVGASNGLDVKSSYVVRGLANLGNTCFFNSVLQNLLAMDVLRDYFIKLDVTIGPLTMAFKKIFVETQPETGLKNVINPRAFFGCLCTKAPQFKGYHQHDSHELLRCLLDAWSTEELGTRKRTNSSKENGVSSSPVHTFVDAVFGGQVSSTVCCTECRHSSTVYEPFLDLSLPVPTKKPMPKKAQQNTRSKKPKLPLKRLVKNRPKINKPVGPEASTSRELPPQSQLSSAAPTVPAEENCSDAQNSPAIAESENKEAVVGAAEQISVSLDDDTWLDYIEPEAPVDGYDYAPTDIVNSIFQDSEAELKNTLVDDVPLLTDTELEPKDVLVNDEALKGGTESEDKNTLLNDVPVQTDTEAGVQASPINEESDTKPQYSSVNPWEDEIPLQVQNSEVLLLPYKEESSVPVDFGEAEASSGILDGGQEEFDGLGDLFNEPEESSSHIAGPSANNDVLGTGFMATNSSESDPDEVDNSDSPVSIETCLTHFTKPELLSNENAWHCENCSKANQRQKLEVDKQSKYASKTSVNGCGTGTESDIESVDKDPNVTEAEFRGDNGNIQRVSDSNKSQDHTEKENGQMDEPASIASHGERGNIEMKEEVEGQSNSLGASYHTCREGSLSDRATVSGCVDKPNSAGSIAAGDQEGESKLLNANYENDEDSEDGEANSETVKLRRDATKRVLINKAPPILTIHLKRFSQDARGRLSKLNGHVTFREMLDLKPYMDARCIGDERCDYSLIGVVEHQGTMRRGHYVAYVRGRGGKGNDGGSAWFHASDVYIRETNIEEVLRSEAYILFYEKV